MKAVNGVINFGQVKLPHTLCAIEDCLKESGSPLASHYSTALRVLKQLADDGKVSRISSLNFRAFIPRTHESQTEVILDADRIRKAIQGARCLWDNENADRHIKGDMGPTELYLCIDQSYAVKIDVRDVPVDLEELSRRNNPPVEFDWIVPIPVPNN